MGELRELNQKINRCKEVSKAILEVVEELRIRLHVRLSNQQIRLATAIDDHVNRILANGGGDEALLRSLYVHMDTFKQLLDLSSQAEIDTLSERYDGFFRYAKLLETIASGLADGSITVPE